MNGASVGRVGVLSALVAALAGAVPCEAQVVVRTARPAHVFRPDEPVTVELQVAADPTPPSADVTLTGADGAVVAQEAVTLRAGSGTFRRDPLPTGWYGLAVSAAGRPEPYRDAIVVLPEVEPLGTGQPSMFGVDWTGTQGEDDFAAMAQAGARWVRCNAFTWVRFEPRAGELDWTAADQAVGRAERHGLRVLGVIGHAAPWNATVPRHAGSGDIPTWYTSPYRRHVEWDRAAQGVFERYCDRVHLWELWHEADSAFYVGTWDRYLEALKIAASRLREADPAGRMVYGGSAGSESLMAWTARATEGAYFDYNNGHYPFDGPADGRGLEPPEAFRFSSPQVAQRYGLVQPLLITEAGVGFTEADGLEAAAGLSRILTQASAVRCPQWCWFAWQGRDGTCLVERRGEELVPRPNYAAYANVARRLEGAHFMGRPRLGPEAAAYLFVKRGEPVLVVWRPGGDGALAGLGGEAAAEACDFLGRPLALRAGEPLTAGEEPTFVELRPARALPLLAGAVRDSLQRQLNTKIGQDPLWEEGGPDEDGDGHPDSTGLSAVGVFREDLQASCGVGAVARAQSLGSAAGEALDAGDTGEAIARLRELRDAYLEFASQVTVRIAAHEAAPPERPLFPPLPGTEPKPPNPRAWGGHDTTGYPRGVEWLRRLLLAAYSTTDMLIGLRELGEQSPVPGGAALPEAERAQAELSRRLAAFSGPFGRLARAEVLADYVEDWLNVARETRDEDVAVLVAEAAGIVGALAEAEPPLVTKVFCTVEMPTAEQLVQRRDLRAGVSHPLVVTVWNHAEVEAQGGLHVSAPATWTVSPADMSFTVPPGEHSGGLVARVQLPAGGGVRGEIRLSGELSGGEALPEFWYAVNAATG